jgi:P4 family phage/plasmid primase-like protien
MPLTLTECTSCIVLDKKGNYAERLDIAKTVAWIQENVPIRTILETKKMLFYRNGIYIPGGEEFVSRILATTFGSIHTQKDTAIYNRHTKNEILMMLRDLTYTEISDFDKDLAIINIKSGLYNWQTRELLDHDPAYFSMIQCPIVYEPSATCLAIDKLIQTVADEKNQQKCYEYIAYCLYRSYPIQKMFLLFGPGNTGKTYYMDVIQKTLGDANCSHVTMQDLACDRFATSDLYLKLSNICGDLDNTALRQVAALKQLTSNKDYIRAQEKGEKAFDFVNFAKLIFGANKLPASSDDSTGFFRRCEIIPFMHVFKPDEFDQSFLDETTSEAEISGLFNKLVKILPGLIERHEFTNQLDIDTVKLMYADRSAPEESFFDQFVCEMPGQYTQKAMLHMYYKEYCQKIGVPSKSINLLGRYITQNVEWIKKRAYYDNRNDHKSNYSTTIDGQKVAAWPDTYFDYKAFIAWKKL